MLTLSSQMGARNASTGYWDALSETEYPQSLIFCGNISYAVYLLWFHVVQCYGSNSGHCFIFVFKSMFLFLFFPLVSRIMSLSFIHHSHVPIFVFSYILLFSPQCPTVYSRPPRNLFPKILLNVCCHSLDGREEGGVYCMAGLQLQHPHLCMVLCFLNTCLLTKMFISIALLVSPCDFAR